MGTKIEWAEETWNPIIGCSKVSPGCDNCYAERMAKRLCAMGQEGYFPVVNPNGWSKETNFIESALEKPLHWKKPRTIFVCSMGDLFHETVSFNDILEVIHIIDKCPQHTFLILTKRPQRMHEFFTDWVPNPFWINGDYLPNVWLGVTAENQEQADKRIPVLLDIPAAKRFVSIEPMLGPVDLDLMQSTECSLCEGIGSIPVDGGGKPCENCLEDSNSRGYVYLKRIDWVICGAESGPGRRDCKDEWVKNLIDQCKIAQVPFLLKQLFEDNKKVVMPFFYGRVWNQKP